MTRRYARFFLALAAGLFLAACSISRLAYINAAPLTLWYVGGYIDMSGTQKGWLRERLATTIAWHRQEELPAYRRTIEAAVQKLDGPVSVADVRQFYGDARRYYNRLVEHALPDVADLALTLDAEQARQLERKFAEDNKKYVKDSVRGTADERFEREAKKYIERFEDFTGHLSDAQRAIIVNGLKSQPDMTSERLGDRRFRQGEALALLRAKPDRERVIAGLRRILIETETWRRPEFTQKLRERDERLFQIVATLSATLTPEQRASVKKKLRGYVQDIAVLTASSGTYPEFAERNRGTSPN